MKRWPALILVAASASAFAQLPSVGGASAREQPVAAITGGPSPPVLIAPAAGNALSTTGITLNWAPSPAVTATQPAPTRYEICLAEPQAPCINGSRALVVRDLAQLADAGRAEYELGVGPGLLVEGGQSSQPIRQPVTRTTITLPVPHRFHGRRFTWSVAACGPAPSRVALAGSAVPERCNYSQPRELAWRILPPELLEPNVSVPAGHTRLTPQFAIRRAVVWADYYLFCISRPGLACGPAPISTVDQLILRSSELAAVPAQPLLQFQGRAMRWTAAACNVQFGCTYQVGDRPLDVPVVGPMPPAPILSAPANNVWVDAAQRQVSLSWVGTPGATHYAVCASPPGVACGASGSVVARGITANAIAFNLPATLGANANWTVAACNVADECRYQAQFRALRIRPAVADDLRVLTYNVYLRPTDLFKNGQNERAELLPSQLDGYDAIIFNEAFDNPARAKLLAGLGQYIFRTPVVGSDRGAEQDGGVIIVSRWQFTRQDSDWFRDCTGADCLSQKGVNYARICKNGKPYNIFALHLQANHDREHQNVQRAQLQFVRQFINRQNIPPNEPVLIGGDFNLRRDSGTGRSVEFGWIRELLNAEYPANVTDLPQRCTYCFGLNELAGDEAEGRVTLDYLVTSLGHKAPFSAALQTVRIQSPTPWREYFFERTMRDLSDHYPVAGQFRFMWPDDQGC